jgi:hypothetical protein
MMKRKRLMLAILKWLLPAGERDALLGDLEETRSSGRELPGVVAYAIRTRLRTSLSQPIASLVTLALVSVVGGLYIRSSGGFRNPERVSAGACFAVLFISLVALRRMRVSKTRDRFLIALAAFMTSLLVGVASSGAIDIFPRLSASHAARIGALLLGAMIMSGPVAFLSGRRTSKPSLRGAAEFVVALALILVATTIALQGAYLLSLAFAAVGVNCFWYLRSERSAHLWQRLAFAVGANAIAAAIFAANFIFDGGRRVWGDFWHDGLLLPELLVISVIVAILSSPTSSATTESPQNMGAG